jgi:AcrR family transcriptional regulator
MARPRSEDKPAALFRAATEIIAAQGLGASTASIAKLAGVAEGTLFRYFPTKDILLEALFTHLVEDLEATLSIGCEPTAPVEQRTWVLWNNYVDWGIAKPAEYATMNRLVVSGKLSPEQIDKAMTLCGDVGVRLGSPDFEGLTQTQSREFLDSVLTAIANTTVSMATTTPELKDAYKVAGFTLLRKTMALEDM